MKAMDHCSDFFQGLCDGAWLIWTFPVRCAAAAASRSKRLLAGIGAGLAAAFGFGVPPEAVQQDSVRDAAEYRRFVDQVDRLGEIHGGPETGINSPAQAVRPVILSRKLQSPPAACPQKKICLSAAQACAEDHYNRYPGLWKQCGPRMGMFYAAMDAEGLDADQCVRLHWRLMHFRRINRMRKEAGIHV